MGVFVGWLLVGPACAPDHPAASQSGRRRTPPALAVRSEPNRKRPSAEDGRPAPARESHAGAPSPDTAELEAHYKGRRALSALEGEASYYGDSLAGHRTANGDRYDPRAYTAAHRTLPFGTILRVIRKDAKAVVYVRVTDRGPYGSARRILDLSRAAAERLHMIRTGVAKVRAEIVEYGPRKRHRR